ncbi:PEP-CTERM sorting domain-containing protein [Pseudoduganella sp. RAF19]|uniref:PEP-CTERM sorting domain-containing protein n=1 Tax=Pseudoduganella sp. RAF19 TaxID=3233052 RepID=UPI003F9910A9
MKLLQKSLGACAGAIALLFSMSAQADTVLDLTTAGASHSLNGATYTQVPAQPTGSGVLKSFVRIRDNADLVQGYNTTVSGTYQNDGSDTFNHEVTVGQIGFIDLGGGNLVMRFLLDINQTKESPLLSLDDVQIYISGTPNQSIEPTMTQGSTLNLGTLVYQLDQGGIGGQNNQAQLNYALNTGSGSGDMFLDIPFSMFDAAFNTAGLGTDAAKNGAYIYLYSRFGTSPTLDPGLSPNNDGYEEWAYIKGAPVNGECVPTPQNPCGGPPQEIPEPGTLALLGAGLLGLAYKRRKQT